MVTRCARAGDQSASWSRAHGALKEKKENFLKLQIFETPETRIAISMIHPGVDHCNTKDTLYQGGDLFIHAFRVHPCTVHPRQSAVPEYRHTIF
jgi:hypothetical protein